MELSNARLRHLYSLSFFLNDGKLLLCLFLFFFNFISSQIKTGNQLINEQSITIECDDILKTLLGKSNIPFLNALNKLEELQNRVIASNDVSNLLFFYYKRAEISIWFNDYVDSSKYIDKGLELLKTHPNNRYLGLFTELIGIIENNKNKYSDSKNKFEKRDKAIINTELLLRKYGNDEDNIDANFNLCLVYKDRKDWDKVYFHALRSKELIRKTNKKKNNTCILNLYISESLINMNQLQEGLYFLNITKNDSLILAKNEQIMQKFYSIDGLYNEAIGDYKAAAVDYSECNRYNFLLLKKQNKQTNKFLSMRDGLRIKQIENQKIAIENELNKKNIEYRNYAIFLTLFIILVLVSLLLLLNKSLKYKLETNKKLEVNNKELIKVNRQIKKAIYDKKFFLDTITHELRTPLNTMKGVSYLLNNTREVDKMEYVETINFSSDYLLKLINNMIDFNSFDKNQKTVLHNEIVNLKELIDKIISTYSTKEGQENEFIFNHDNLIADQLLIDKFRIAQILINLLDNANKFTDKGKIIIKTKLLSSEPNFNRIEFFIQDEGIGIEEKNQSKIFDLFFQGSKEINRKYGGSGIGLSIVKKTIELYKSDIIVKSDLGKGTTISFILTFEIARTI